MSEAEKVDQLFDQKQRAQMHRNAFRRVFAPDEGEEASAEDRVIVLSDLAKFCSIETPFIVQEGVDAGHQLAVQEGRRCVYLRIAQAIKMSRQDRSREAVKAQLARTE